MDIAKMPRTTGSYITGGNGHLWGNKIAYLWLAATPQQINKNRNDGV